MSKLILTILISGAVFLGFSSETFAAEASMRLSPSTGMHTEGSSFKVDVIIDTDGNPINAAEARMTFDPQAINVVSIESENSIFSSWVERPDFSNELGIIEFAGTVSSGFEGFEGKVMTINFVALRNGVARVRFSSGAIIAADGRGSNIISSLMSGVYTLTPGVVEFLPTQDHSAPINAPGAPHVTSETHPDSENWHSRDTVALSWHVPDGVTASRMLLDRSSNVMPETEYEDHISERTYRFLDDGVWYFYLQLQNSNGWGDVSTFKIQIDTQKPERFNVKSLPRNDLTDPSVRFLFDAFDNTSGIERYEIQFSSVNSEDVRTKTWLDSGNQIYKTAPLEPGDYTIITKAIDAAGNYLVDMEEFKVRPIDSPIFDKNSYVIDSGDPLVLEGSAKPDSEVFFLISRGNSEPQKHSTFAEDDGRFLFVLPQAPEDGTYQAQAYVVDSRGAKSELSAPATVGVNTGGVARLGSAALNTVSFAIPLSASVFVLIILLLHLKHKFMLLQNRLKQEVGSAETAVHKAFIELKDEVDRNVRSLERVKDSRGLTREEIEVMDSLSGRLIRVEKIFEKEMDKIENMASSQELDVEPVTWKKPKTIIRKWAS
ncbi:MAG: cohesin domain-containing protein [Candidatus Spechtbacterales bacterium]